jgi:hypothetical protein
MQLQSHSVKACQLIQNLWIERQDTETEAYILGASNYLFLFSFPKKADKQTNIK